MGTVGDLRTLGLRKSRPLPAGHPDVGEACFLCKRPIEAGDQTAHLTQNPDDHDSLSPIVHWECIQGAFDRLRDHGNAAPGTTRRFLEARAKGPETTGWDAAKANFVLQHGRSYEWRALPRGVRPGEPRRCFDNAVGLALRSSALYTYAEGYAINRWVAGHPVHHAWCIDREGFVVDPTWDNGADYLGVPFSQGYVRLITSLTNGRGLIDNAEMDYPLLTGEHPAKGAIKC